MPFLLINFTSSTSSPFVHTSFLLLSFPLTSPSTPLFPHSPLPPHPSSECQHPPTHLRSRNVRDHGVSIISIQLHVVTQPYSSHPDILASHPSRVSLTNHRHDRQRPRDSSHVTSRHMDDVIVEKTQKEVVHADVTFHRPCLFFSIV